MNGSRGSLSARGQFFSPDLIIAVFIFVLCLVFFSLAASSIGASTDALESQKNLDETGHMLIRSLTASEGQPRDWEDQNISDVNFFGLVHERTVIDAHKAQALMQFLDANYMLSKKVLGAGAYDVHIRLIDSNGDSLLSGGIVAPEYKQASTYALPVLYQNEPAVLEVVFSHA